MEPRLQARYHQLVREHCHAAQPLAAGIHALPTTASALASTMGAYRFFRNPRVTLPVLLDPLQQAGHAALAARPGRYALVVHDWSRLDYATHTSKRDRAVLGTQRELGYDLATALLVDAATGVPLAPLELRLRTAEAVHSTRLPAPSVAANHLDEVLPTLTAVQQLALPKQLVHVLDREADSVFHLRKWAAAGQCFLVRADATRQVRWRGTRMAFDAVIAALQRRGAFVPTRTVTWHGQPAEQWVAETTLVLDRPARLQRGRKGQRQRIVVAGAPLRVRLIVCQVLDEQGRLLAEWRLLTNVVGVPAARLALWYYWRWQIESYFKLLKGAGLSLEDWQQETGEAIAKRLLVASMACVLVWQLAHHPAPEADRLRQWLIRLSGRQMKSGQEFTAPALLAGLWVALTSLALVEQGHFPEIQALLRRFLPAVPDTG
jgi:hypothetical protein